jgi:hypothetical protein
MLQGGAISSELAGAVRRARAHWFAWLLTGAVALALLPAAAWAQVPSLNTSALNFAAQLVATSSPAQAITITNTGTAALNISSVTLTGANEPSFATTNTCGAPIAIGARCTVSVSFAPTASGAKSAAVRIASNAATGPVSIALSGTGVSSTPGLLISSDSLSFGTQEAGTSSAPQLLTVTNNTAVSVSIASVTVSGANVPSFGSSNSCGAPLAAGAHCTVSVSFSPKSAGALSAYVTLASNAANTSTLLALLSGTGVSPSQGLTVSLHSLSFGNQQVGTLSASQTLIVSNTTTAAVTISTVSLMGSNAPSFAATNTCGAPLAAGAQCTISVGFVPGGLGAKSAIVSIASTAAAGKLSVGLSGTGVAATVGLSVSPMSVGFGNQQINTPSGAQLLSVTNTTAAPVTISTVTLTGANVPSFASTNTCGAPLAIGERCSISVVFTPPSTGSKTANVSIASSAGPATTALSGTGTAVTVIPTISPMSLSFGGQQTGTASAPQLVTVTNTTAVPFPIKAVTLSSTNVPSFAVSNDCGVPVPAGAQCTITVSFAPPSAGAKSATLTITSTNGDSPVNISLSGAGAATSILGHVVDAVVSGAEVSAYTITANGIAGVLLAGPVVTAPDGSYTLNLGTYSGPVLLESIAGTYTDPANFIPNITAPTLMAIVPSVTGTASGNVVSANITPLTTIAAQMELTLIGQTPGIDIPDTAQAMNNQVAQWFTGSLSGFATTLLDLTQPYCANGASQASIDESFILAGLAYWAMSANVSEPALINALVEDATDGVFNGYEGGQQLFLPPLTGDTAVELSTIENGSTLPGNAGALPALGLAVQQFAGSGSNICQAEFSSGLPGMLANPTSPMGALGSFPVYFVANLPAGTGASLLITFNLTGGVTYQEDTGALADAETTVTLPWPIGPWQIASDIAGASWSAQVVAPANETCSVTPISGSFAVTSLAATGINTATTPLTLNCSVGTPPITSIDVVPSNPSPIWVYDYQPFRAVAILSGGATQDVTASVGWTSSNPSDADMIGPNSDTAQGLKPAVGLTITASLGFGLDLTGTAQLTVAAGRALSSLQVSPPPAGNSPGVNPGDTQQFTALGGFTDGYTQDLTSVATWTSADPSQVSILTTPNPNAGLATGVAVTSTPVMITASVTVDGIPQTGTSQLSVLPPVCLSSGPGPLAGQPPYYGQAFCTTFYNMTDVGYEFMGNLTFLVSQTGTIEGCELWSSNVSGSMLSGVYGAACNTGATISATSGSTCGTTTQSAPSFKVEDNLGNELCGTFSVDGTSISGNYFFGDFGPQGGIAVGVFPSSPP